MKYFNKHVRTFPCLCFLLLLSTAITLWKYSKRLGYKQLSHCNRRGDDGLANITRDKAKRTEKVTTFYTKLLLRTCPEGLGDGGVSTSINISS